MVIHFPKENATEDDDWLDIAVPETNVTVIKNDGLHTGPLDALGD
jgi:hypothetical protein